MSPTQSSAPEPRTSFLVEGRAIWNVHEEVVVTLATGVMRFTTYLTPEEARHLAEEIERALERTRPA